MPLYVYEIVLPDGSGGEQFEVIQRMSADPLTKHPETGEPVRRVFGSYVFRAREEVDMPPPGDLRPAKFAVETHDLAWEFIYRPLAAAVNGAADRLNRLQFLTIRQYLSLVFAALVTLLLVLAIWS